MTARSTSKERYLEVGTPRSQVGGARDAPLPRARCVSLLGLCLSDARRDNLAEPVPGKEALHSPRACSAPACATEALP